MFLFNKKDQVVVKIVENKKEREDAMDVRKQVFQKDMGIDPESDFDGKDDRADHIIAYVNGKEAGTLRIRYDDDGELGKVAEFERIAVLRKFRGQNIAKQMIEYMFGYLKSNGTRGVVFKAQEHTKGFYEQLGFVQQGNAFADGGVLHVRMFKVLY